MTVLLIILGIIVGIILAVVILLHFSVRAYVEADKAGLDLKAKYLWFTVYKLKLPEKEPEDKPPEGEPPAEAPEIILEDIPEAASTESPEDSAPPADEEKPEEKSPEPSEQSDGSKEPPEEEENEDTPKPSLLDMWNEYKKYIPAGKKAFRKLLKLIRIYDLEFMLKIGSEDPYKAGLNFGRLNAAVYSLLGLLCCIFTVTIRHTEIKCDFEHKATDYYLKTAVYVRPSAVVALAAYVGIYYLKIRKSMKKLENKAKATEKENSNE